MCHILRKRDPGPCAAVWLSLFVLGWIPSAIPADLVEEYTAKAALVYKFARYTNWPEAAVAESPDDLRVCVVGDEIVVAAFQGINGQHIGQRHLRIRVLGRWDDPGSCDLIFVADRTRRRIAALFSTIRDLPILTIGEIPGFTDYGGIINLYRSGGKIRFEVSLKAAKRANLAISSRLLRLAKILK